VGRIPVVNIKGSFEEYYNSIMFFNAPKESICKLDLILED
jgi:hypothetical protein